MSLSRKVKADVKSAIKAKDDELEKMVATMDEEELRVLAESGPHGMEDINLWKRDRRKRSWRRLSAFGVVRNDPALYRRWKQQRHQHMSSHSRGTKIDIRGQDGMLGTTCAVDVMRRQPWSTDLHYTHKSCAQQKQARAKPKGEEHAPASNSSPSTTQGNLDRTAPKSRMCVHTARRTLPSRPATAPLRPADRFVQQPPHRPESARTPSLARLARVFYQSSIASTACMSDECSSHRGRGKQTVCPESPENGCAEPHGEIQDTSCKRRDESGLGGAEKRMESIRLLWAVSQLSADAVTKKIMHGYTERQRAREPNRRPQPPGSQCNAHIAGRRKRESIAGRRIVG